MGYQIDKYLNISAVWDFAVDGGAAGTFTVLDVPINFRVEDIIYEVETAVTSGGTPTITIGDGDDADGYFVDFQASMGVAGVKGTNEDDKGALAWDDTNDARNCKIYAAADTIDLVVGTAALTAGKIKITVMGRRIG